MSRRLRRLPTALLPLVLAAGALTACGGNDGSSSSASSPSSADGLAAVTIDGEVGSEPKVTWKSAMTSDKVVSKTLTTGDGAPVEDGDSVSAQIWIGDGVTKEKSYSTYDAGAPQSITLNSQLSPFFSDAIKGKTVGSRIATTAPADKVFGAAGNTQLGIGNKDAVLVIIDLVGKPLDGPQGKAQKAPAWTPKVVEKGGDVTGLDFSGTPKPNGKLREATLVKGSGDVVKKGQTITVNYLGEVYAAAKPFDESYSKSPASFPIGQGSVVPGWDKTLVGDTVGSRVLLAIPPKDGYGAKGQPSAGIKGTDTLYFVVDILAAS